MGGDLPADQIKRRRLDVVDLMELEAELGLSVVLGGNLFRWVRDLNAVNPYPHQVVPAKLLGQRFGRNSQIGTSS